MGTVQATGNTKASSSGVRVRVKPWDIRVRVCAAGWVRLGCICTNGVRVRVKPKQSGVRVRVRPWDSAG